MKLELYCDGASRGNPGAGAYGYVILEHGQVIAERAEILGTVTNNVAEYQGLLEGVKECVSLGAKELVVKSDSELMVRQLNGVYKVKSPHLIPLFETARGLLKQIPQVKVLHVRREENKLADALANKALDNAGR
jgi:ribonuclease HI